MPAGDSFKVDPEALRKVARDFDAQAAGVPGMSSRFTAPAQDISDAFGLLGPSDECYTSYESSVTHALKGLADLQKAIEAVATGLRTSADRYDGSDQASTMSGKP